jgi:mycothiol synthase
LLHLPKLTNTQQEAVLKLIAGTTTFDNTPPIAEHILLHLRHGGDKADSHLLVEQESQVIGYAHLDQTDLVVGPSIELVVDPKFRGVGVGKQLLSKAIEICGRKVRLWVHGDQPAANALATSFGFEKSRTVLKMSRPLTDIQQIPNLDKAVGEDIVIRNFLPGIDSDAWLSLNNKMFKDHPEQGNWQLSDLNIRLNEEWFDEKSLFLAEKNKHIVGSVWTKIHGSKRKNRKIDGEPPVGEIYIIAVDSDYLNLGIGGVLLKIGLNNLISNHIKFAFLYVDADNLRAVNFYKKNNFKIISRDYLYKLN